MGGFIPLIAAGLSVGGSIYNAKKAREDYANQIQTRVADAKAAGISPLAAMGFAGSGPPNISPLGAALQGTGSMLEDMMQRRMELEDRKTEAELDAVRMQTELSRLELYKRQLQMRAATSLQHLEAQPGVQRTMLYRATPFSSPSQSIAGNVKPGPRLTEGLGQPVVDSSNLVHGSLFTIPYGTIAEDVQDQWGVAGEVAAPLVAGGSFLGNLMAGPPGYITSMRPSAPRRSSGVQRVLQDIGMREERVRRTTYQSPYGWRF